MSNNTEVQTFPENMSIADLEGLFVSPEEEKIIAEKNNKEDFEYKLTAGNKKLEIVGTPHPYTLAEAKGIQDALSLENTVDLLLIEGTAALEFSKDIPQDAKPEDVIAQYGEQTYAAWLARKRGIEIKSWDIPMRNLLADSRTKFSNEAIVGFIAGMGAKHIIDKGDPLEANHLVQMISASLGMTPTDMQDELGIEFSETSVQDAVRKYLGTTFEEITYDAAESIATPRHRGETNDVVRFMNVSRDRHLLETLEKNSDKNNIVAVCGKSHAITWKPALEKLYNETTEQLPDRIEKLLFVEDLETARPPLLADVPHYKLETMIEGLSLLQEHAEIPKEEYGSFIANGHWAMVFRSKYQGKDVAAKIFYGIGMSPQEAEDLTNSLGMSDGENINVQNQSSADMTLDWHHRLLSGIGGMLRFQIYSKDPKENDVIKLDKVQESVQMEVGALKKGNSLKNRWVPPVRGVLTYNGRACGYMMPFIEGEFQSIEDTEYAFPEAANVKAELKAAGIIFDESANHNTVVMKKTGTPVFFDLGLNSPEALNDKN